MFKTFKKTFLSLFYVFLYFFFRVKAVLADPPEGIIDPEDGKYATGNYKLPDFVEIFVKVSKWVLFISGALSLLAFVVGGFMFIFSAGNKEWVDKGKGAIIASVIGLVVVFTAYMVIDYFLESIGFDGGAFGGDWNVAPN